MSDIFVLFIGGWQRKCGVLIFAYTTGIVIIFLDIFNKIVEAFGAVELKSFVGKAIKNSLPLFMNS